LHRRLAFTNLFWQVSDADLFSAAKHQAAFQCILQFPNIARPVVSLDGGKRLAREACRAAETRGMHLQKGLREHRDIRFMCAQRGQFHVDYAQAIEQVFAKPAGANLGG